MGGERGGREPELLSAYSLSAMAMPAASLTRSMRQWLLFSQFRNRPVFAGVVAPEESHHDEKRCDPSGFCSQAAHTPHPSLSQMEGVHGGGSVAPCIRMPLQKFGTYLAWKGS